MLVSIEYPLDENNKNTIRVESGEVKGIDKSKRVATGAGKFYKVEAEYSDNGLINKITVNL